MTTEQATYFVIEVDDDGEIRISEYTEERLAIAHSVGEIASEEELRTDLSERDPAYWSKKTTLIIKGEIVSRYPSVKVAAPDA